MLKANRRGGRATSKEQLRKFIIRLNVGSGELGPRHPAIIFREKKKEEEIKRRLNATSIGSSLT